MIEYQLDNRLNKNWIVTRSIFIMPKMPNPKFANEIYLAKNEDYLTFKLTSESRIYVIAVCGLDKIFN